jgi:hypothetical protein
MPCMIHGFFFVILNDSDTSGRQGQLCFPLAQGVRYGVAVLSSPASAPGFYGGAPSTVAAATIAPLIPPARLLQLAVGATSVTLGWDSAAVATGTPLDYRVEYENMPSGVVFSAAVPASAADRGVFVVTGLTNGEPYRFTVKVR